MWLLLIQFPPEFEVGDGEGMDMKLPNHVYNKLKSHSLSENKRSHRVHEKKEHSTAVSCTTRRRRLTKKRSILDQSKCVKL